jgi:hypothetical protein
MIWYGAYGSNLLLERFLVYLRGGPVPGSGRMQHGARDSSDPQGDEPLPIDRPLGFGRESAGWGGGGVCFVDPAVRAVDEAGVGETLGRAWLITVEQLADVWAQENGGTVGPPIDVDRLLSVGSLELPSADRLEGRPAQGWYRSLILLGELGGYPVATITCDVMPTPNASGLPYLEVVGRGLMETWGLDPSEAARYLATRIGNRGLVDETSLTELLARPSGR